LSGARLKEEFGRHGDMLQILLRYTQALITQMARPRSVTGIIRWISNCAAGSSYPSTG
jgi:hypothetical protein